jgi:hypothetical protein
VSVCVGVLCVFTKNIAQEPVEEMEAVEEAFSRTPPEIVSATRDVILNLLPEKSKNLNQLHFPWLPV